MSVLIDTLAARQGLVAAGIEPAQAEAIVGAFAYTGEQVATKADIQRLETEIAGVNLRTDGLKTELKAEIAGVKTQVAALEAKIDAKISAAANRLLAALVAVGGLLYAALRIF